MFIENGSFVLFTLLKVKSSKSGVFDIKAATVDEDAPLVHRNAYNAGQTLTAAGRGQVFKLSPGSFLQTT